MYIDQHPVRVGAMGGYSYPLSAVEWALLLQILHEKNNELSDQNVPPGFYSLLSTLTKVDGEIK